MTINTSIQTLDLELLRQGLPGVEPARAVTHLICCVLCLSSYGHSVGVRLQINGFNETSFNVIWNTVPTPQQKRSYDFHTMKEDSACAIAFLAVLRMTPYTVIYRTPIGTGVDYMLGHKIVDPNDLNFLRDAARLEVSGIGTQTKSNNIRRRSKIKRQQTMRSANAGLPAYTFVLEHSMPEANMEIV